MKYTLYYIILRLTTRGNDFHSSEDPQDFCLHHEVCDVEFTFYCYFKFAVYSTKQVREIDDKT